MAQLGGHAQFIESRTTQIAHGDTAKEIGEILGRYNDGIAIRFIDWQVGNAYIRDVADHEPGAGVEHAVRHFPPPPGACRSRDLERSVTHEAKRRRSAGRPRRATKSRSACPRA